MCALGTDSLASNPSLSILDEMRYLRSHYRDLCSDQILRMGTINGARGLGLATKTGSIASGKRADLVVVPLETDSRRPGLGIDSANILTTHCSLLCGRSWYIRSREARRQ